MAVPAGPEPHPRRPGRDDSLRTPLPWVGYGVATLLTLWQAIFNGFPLVMVDTFRYLGEAAGDYAWLSTQFYGYLLRVFAGTTLWLVVIVQAVVAVVTVACFLRLVLGFTHRQSALVTSAVAATGSLSLFVGLVMTDLWIALGLLAAITLVVGAHSRRTDVFLASVVTWAAVVHPAALPMLMAIVLLVALAFAVSRFRGGRASTGGLVPLGVAIVLALSLLTVNSRVIWGVWSPNPHSSVVTFTYLLSHGDLEDELRDCDQWEVCDMNARPAGGIRGFVRFMNGSRSYINTQLGGPEQFADEAGSVVVSHVTSDPLQYAGRVLHSGVRQMAKVNGWRHVAGASGLLTESHVSQIKGYSASDVDRFLAGRQMQGSLALGRQTTVQVVFGWLGAAAAVAAIGLHVVRSRTETPGRPAQVARRRIGVAGLVGVYLLHAFVVGAATFPVNRYGSRVLWLLDLAFWAVVVWVVRVEPRSERAWLRSSSDSQRAEVDVTAGHGA